MKRIALDRTFLPDLINNKAPKWYHEGNDDGVERIQIYGRVQLLNIVRKFRLKGVNKEVLEEIQQFEDGNR